ncbi:hypothetical protein C9J12_15355 [Photobacterium frigidiphilum]|uniref:DUF998 domain-containing protein n=2 Tax=Photobacterium frigidiphilum TaxID=264736 RepID=A0A2T3JEN1_9GAMM|nr:hypothetical protein C9J12_15355 [Photobacterium frigidiphilum]
MICNSWCATKGFQMQSEVKPMRIINHKTVRKGIGLIALLMPWAVLWLSGYSWSEMSSISVSYWTDSRDIFVGCLIAVAFALASYNGTGTCRRDTEFWLSKAAGVFALLVALFPTICSFEDKVKCTDAPNWIMHISFNHPQYIHYTAAILFFICLILLMSFFSLRAKYKEKHLRSRLYFVISLLMLFGIPTVYIIGELTSLYESTFWAELVGLTLFGIGWLKAGWYKTEPKAYLPKGATLVDIVEVNPKNKNNPTEVVIEVGVEYFFKAEGCWKDWFLECGPHGWGPNWNPLNYNNRIEWKPLFLLCGNIGKNWNDEDRTFCIGDRNTWALPSGLNDLNPEERKLYLFANDWKTRYGNNYVLEPKEGGPLKVEIYRLQSNEE